MTDLWIKLDIDDHELRVELMSGTDTLVASAGLGLDGIARRLAPFLAQSAQEASKLVEERRDAAMASWRGVTAPVAGTSGGRLLHGRPLPGAEPAPAWKRIEDGEPKWDDTVIVAVRDVGDCRTVRGPDQWWEAKDLYHQRKHRITHWMPFVRPPLPPEDER